MSAPITLWWRIVDDNEEEFNHIEDGHSQEATPKIKVNNEAQRAWAKSRWTKEHAYMRNIVSMSPFWE